ncbi:hypothetical protein [Aliiglaciecola sp. NS0011-25]|uniref:hypothetical protein n=1 Tax=Aliiglaciecola sp. NS0011-25 TaxID=3127654 RepID=UPI0031039EF5
MNLECELVNFIDDKAIRECGDTALLNSSVYTRQLNDHINGIHELSNHEIAEKLDCLVRYFTITLDFPLQDMELLRVRLCEGKNFNNVDELSYIKQTNDTFPKAGRMNLSGQSLFYASVAVRQDDTALRVVLSEARAKQLDRLNVVRSHQISGSDLNVRLIGLWDQVRRNEKPYYLKNDTFDYCKKVREYMVQKFDPKLLLAFDLTDRFFADILSRAGSERLYEVTSVLSSIFIDGKVDGVLYSSVQAKGEAVVALKPQAVDDKLEHQFVTDVLVEKSFGYEFYQFKTLAKTSDIDKMSGKLKW